MPGGQHKLFEVRHGSGYALKADVRHYFDSMDHRILLRIIGKRITDPSVLWLIRVILKNHRTETQGRGMPIGNLTSQFFANVYLNELDQFVKHTLKVKYYIRYVDDFVIMHRDKKTLQILQRSIDDFLRQRLRLELHPEKTRIISLDHGVTFLGFRIFLKYRLLKKSNSRRIWKRIEKLKQRYLRGEISIEGARRSLDGWMAYAKFANTYNLRRKSLIRFKELFDLMGQ